MANPPVRTYMYWEDSDLIEWKVKKEYDGRKSWQEKWGDQWMKQYEKWICTDIRRAMRKPSLRSLEWIAWQRKNCLKNEVPGVAEVRTRKGVFMEPPKELSCCPGRWPPTTYGEIGYLGQHKCCDLEIYGNKFMQKPPLPWYMRKISSLPSATAKF